MKVPRLAIGTVWKTMLRALALALAWTLAAVAVLASEETAAPPRRPGPLSPQGLGQVGDAPDEDSSPGPGLEAVAGAIRGFTCPVPDYGDVAVVDKPDLNNLALAERIQPGNRLVIYVRSDLMAKFHLPTRLFWLEHECAHHTLGHTQETALPPPEQLGREEVAADCGGIREVVARVQPGADEIETILNDMQGLPGGDGYPSGAERAQLMLQCLGVK